MENKFSNKTSVVVTSINSPNDILRSIANGARDHNADFIIIGDTKSPPCFNLPGADFWGMDRQLGLGSKFANACPTRHYARKNLGYLLASSSGSDVIIETDDDNMPLPSFWAPRVDHVDAHVVDAPGWCNVYRYFTDSNIWPRGLPLNFAKQKPLPREDLTTQNVYAPIQQGLADANPDVDAVYRLLFPLPIYFEKSPPVALMGGVFCPFNSQNTTWFKPAFPLLYLPAYCSFRMTDIWRSFVALRVCAENGWATLFHASTVYQERNEHDLMKDFADEVSGYLSNESILKILSDTPVPRGQESVRDAVMSCYKALSSHNILPFEEIELLDLWMSEI